MQSAQMSQQWVITCQMPSTNPSGLTDQRPITCSNTASGSNVYLIKPLEQQHIQQRLQQQQHQQHIQQASLNPNHIVSSQSIQQRSQTSSVTSRPFPVPIMGQTGATQVMRPSGVNTAASGNAAAANNALLLQMALQQNRSAANPRDQSSDMNEIHVADTTLTDEEDTMDEPSHNHSREYNEDENDSTVTISALMKQMEKVTIPLYEKNMDGKRNYRKKDYCFFCERAFSSKISSHYMNVHLDEDEVKQCMLHPLNSVQRKRSLLELQNKGNFRHNIKVIEAGEGELVVARRPAGEHLASSFLPCEYCLGFFLKASLWQHSKTCPLKPQGQQPAATFLRNATAMLAPYVEKLDSDESSLKNIFQNMKETSKNPGVAKVAERDTLINEFAKSLIQRLGNSNEHRRKDLDNIRNKLRLVARMLTQLNENKTRWTSMEEFISGAEFDNIVKSVKLLADESNSPQVAVKLGHYVRQLNLLKISLAIKTNNTIKEEEGKKFQYLFQTHWNNQVACVANRRQRLRLINKPVLPPITEDLVKFKSWIVGSIKELLQIKNPTSSNLTVLAEKTLVRLLLFNKRRPAEVAELKVCDFYGMLGTEDNAEILESLDISEQLLAKRMKVIEVRGKSTRSIRKVFILLTSEMVKAIQYLIKVGRKTDQSYIFSRPTTNTPMDGCDVMRRMTSNCPNLIHPERIRMTKLRKYLATTAQILDMQDNELKMLADHLGHNVAIHTDIYRLQSSLIEKAKVARVLIASENGMLSRYRGKGLSSIDIDDLPVPVAKDSWSSGHDKADAEDSENEHGEEGTNDMKMMNAAANKYTEKSQSGRSPDKIVQEADSDDADSSFHSSCSLPTSPPVSFKIQRPRWTDTENNILFKIMEQYIIGEKMPPTHLVQKAVDKLGGRRTTAQIRAKVHNLISGKQKW